MEITSIEYLQHDDNIGVITLRRPALNKDVVNELNRVLDDVQSSPNIKVLIIKGSEKAFAFGGDIKELETVTSPVQAHKFIKDVGRVFTKIEEMEIPVIASISGFALGGGCELALACDIRVAAENAVFGQPEIKLGLIPGAGGTQRLPRAVGMSNAKQLLYTGKTIDANEAYRLGLVNKVFSTESLFDETILIAKDISSNGGFAQAMLKSAINNGVKMDMRSALQFEGRCFEMLFSTKDKVEGIKAFLEKRKPIFQNS